MLSDVTYMWSGFGLHGFIDRSLHLFSVWIQLKERERERKRERELRGKRGRDRWADQEKTTE